MLFDTIGEEIPMAFDHVSLALSATGVRADVLSATEKNALVIRLRERLGVDVRAHAPWDDNTASDGQPRPDGWEIIRPMLVLRGA